MPKPDQRSLATEFAGFLQFDSLLEQLGEIPRTPENRMDLAQLEQDILAAKASTGSGEALPSGSQYHNLANRLMLLKNKS